MNIIAVDDNKKDQLIKIFNARGRQMEELIAELNKEQSIIKQNEVVLIFILDFDINSKNCSE